MLECCKPPLSAWLKNTGGGSRLSVSIRASAFQRSDLPGLRARASLYSSCEQKLCVCLCKSGEPYGRAAAPQKKISIWGRSFFLFPPLSPPPVQTNAPQPHSKSPNL